MGEYIYTSIDESGKRKKGKIDASTKEAAIEMLQAKGIYVLSVEEDSSITVSKKCKTKLRDIALFSRHIYTMLSSGVNILTAIEVIEEQTDDKFFKVALKDIITKTQQGKALSESMRDNSRAFPELLCTMVEAAELTGGIDKAFDTMATYYDKEHRMKQKVVNATIYPGILITVSLLAISALLIFAVPQFLKVFDEMNVELPIITKIVLGIGMSMKNYWYLFIVFIAIIFIGFKVYSNSQIGGINIDKMKFKIPYVGNILIYASLARFSRTLSSLLEAGVSIIPSIEITKKVVLNKYFTKGINDMIGSMKTGESLSNNLKTISIVPKLFTVMVKTGEDTGQIDYMLLKAAELYENEVETKVTRINTIIEPTIIVFLAIFLGIIMAAIMLPLFTLYGNI